MGKMSGVWPLFLQLRSLLPLYIRSMASLEQKEICQKYGAAHLDAPEYLKVGISLDAMKGVMPLNGLRHLPEGDTSGWYIWAGEHFSDDPDFFSPLHIAHLTDRCPMVIKYLGLAPGWRFLITDTGYEDVWEDTSLL